MALAGGSEQDNRVRDHEQRVRDGITNSAISPCERSSLLTDHSFCPGRLMPHEKELWSQELAARIYMPGCVIPEPVPGWPNGVRHGLLRRIYLSIDSRHGALRQRWETDPTRPNEPCRLCVRVSEELKAHGACQFWEHRQCDLCECIPDMHIAASSGTEYRYCQLPPGANGVPACGRCKYCAVGK